MRTQESGFTLIELLVVVVIIGVLAAIAVPKIFAGLCASKVGQVDGVIGSLNGALSLYFAENSGTFPAASYQDVSSFVVSKYMEQNPESPWNSSYVYTGTTSNYTICVSIDNAAGCDGVPGDGADDYRFYGSANGKVGSTDVDPC